MSKHYWLWLELNSYGYTNKDLGDYVGYSETTIFRYFNGTLKMPTEVLAQLLNLILIERKN